MSYVSAYHRLSDENPVKPVLSTHEQSIVDALKASGNPAGPEARALYDYACDNLTPMDSIHEMYRLTDYSPIVAFPLVVGNK
jgi:hypothetical protein